MRKGRPAPRGRLAAAGRDPVILVIAAATAVGLALRLWQLSRPGYLFGVTEYDDGPYFGSAVRLVDGALPYRDFILVQPPGITLLMVPAALAGKVAGTAWAMAAGRILTTLASTAGITLAGLLARHRGALAALVACGVLAVYPDSVAGAVESWAILPVLVVICLSLIRTGQAGMRRAGVFAGGVAAGFAALVLPFAALAPGRCYDSLIVALVGPRAGVSRVPALARLQEMAGLSYARFPLRLGSVYLPAHTTIVLVTAALVLLTAATPALVALASAPRAARGLTRQARTVVAVAPAVIPGVCAAAGFAAEDGLKPDVSPAVIAAAARWIPPGSCVVTDEVSLLLLADRFSAQVPGCSPVLDGLGTDLALSGGLKPATGAGRVPAVAAVWWQAFRHARFTWLSRLNHRRIAWTPALRGYFRSHFTRVLTDRRGDALYRRGG